MTEPTPRLFSIRDGEAVRACSKRLKLTQAAFANLADLNSASVRKTEVGEAPVTPVLELACSALDADLHLDRGSTGFERCGDERGRQAGGD